MQKIDQLAINTIRFLSAEAIEKAKSGHPGLPLGAAPAAYTLWAKQMKHNPKNTKWVDRDRFVLSAGHGSTLLYSLFHLFGYGTSIEDLKNFRQVGSLTPGHPEYKHTNGVEVTTGPLGQGIANAVGMAFAESYLAAKFNRENYEIINHYTYALCGDGCMMEGISSEAASLAGTLGLSKLVLLYDSNNITIEGSTDIAFTENVGDRFLSYGWNVIKVEDGNDIDTIEKAIENAKSQTEKPTLIEIKTKIGFGAPNKQGKASAHGEPLGEEEIKLTKKALGWDYTNEFHVPDEVKEHMCQLLSSFEEKENNWNELYNNYKNEHKQLAEELEQWLSDEIAHDLLNDDDFWNNYEGDLATRISSEQVLNKLAKYVPNLIGGSADLSPSTKTIMKNREYYSKENRTGSNIHFGIREHAMTAIANGMILHGGLRAYIAGFFVFSDYMKPSLRLAALMELPLINIFTHDSIGVGEDGPTHQPVEQLAALRSIPNFTSFRPADTKETAAAWYVALTRLKSPTALILTRQNLPLLKETGKGALKGAYILKNAEKEIPDVILIASGSEVQYIYHAHDVLKQKGIDARVVSMPSWELFEEQDDAYKQSVLPSNVRNRIAVEALSSFGWERYVGLDGDIISIDRFGASGKYDVLFKQFGFTVENVVERTLTLLKK